MEVRAGAELLGLMHANLKRLEDKEPVAAALASVVSSFPPSETMPIPGFEEMTKGAYAKVKAWRTAARKGKGKDAALEPMFGATWGEETFVIRYRKFDASASTHPSLGTQPDFQRTCAPKGTEGDWVPLARNTLQEGGLPHPHA